MSNSNLALQKINVTISGSDAEVRFPRHILELGLPLHDTLQASQTECLLKKGIFVLTQFNLHSYIGQTTRCTVVGRLYWRSSVRTGCLQPQCEDIQDPSTRICAYLIYPPNSILRLFLQRLFLCAHTALIPTGDPVCSPTLTLVAVWVPGGVLC